MEVDVLHVSLHFSPTVNENPMLYYSLMTSQSFTILGYIAWGKKTLHLLISNMLAISGSAKVIDLPQSDKKDFLLTIRGKHGLMVLHFA